MSATSGNFLTPPDEFFTHQVPFPHAVVGSSDPAWRERYWFSIQDTATKDVVMTCGVGHYPNQNTQEAFVALSTGGVQHNLRLARALLPDSHLTRVGPFRVEVVEPLRTLRLVLEENPSGVEFDVVWSGTMAPLLEDRHFQLSRAKVVHDLIRYVQVGRVSGTMRAPGREFTLDEATWWGERDHSWGLRPIPSVEGEPPTLPPEWRLLMFAPLQFETFGLHLYLYEAQPGRPLHLSAGIMRPPGHDRGDDDMIDSVAHELRWRDDTPVTTLDGGSLTVTLMSGRKLEIELVSHPGRAYLRGGGYAGINGWFQGHWKGDDSLEHETWDLNDTARLPDYAKASSDHLVEAHCDDELGYGVIEYVVLRGYPKYPAAVRAAPAR
jgi:hypothetical protein